MCTLYSFTKNQWAIMDVDRVMQGHTGKLLLLPCIFPDYAAPMAPPS